MWGTPALASASELRRPVDLAVVAIPAGGVVRAVEECADAGIRAAMVVSSGFAEAGDEGAALQGDLQEVARSRRVALLGPNVEGYLNHRDGIAPYGAGLPQDPRPGGLAVVSQSGTVAWSMAHLASDRAVGCDLVTGVGNEAGVTIGDALRYLARRPGVRAVAAYAESIRDPERMADGLDALRARGIPVVVCAPGRGAAARRAVVAHTGALAGPTGVRDAWLRAHGAVLVTDPTELFEAAALFLRARRPRRPGVGAAMQSGGACTLFAEAAEREGLAVPPLSPAGARRAARVLPAFARPGNPLDVTGQAPFDPPAFVFAVETLFAEPGIGIVAVDAVPPRAGGDERWTGAVLTGARDAATLAGGLALSVAMTPLALSEEGKRFVERTPVPFLQGARPAAAAIRALLEWRSRSPRPPALHPARAAALRSLRGRSGPLDEPAARALLARYGVRGPREIVAATPEEAGAAAARLGFPVAVKAIAADLPHKAAAGGVMLGVRSADAARDAARTIGKAVSGAGFLVQRMVSGSEVLVGAVVDDRFGPAVTIRAGGAEVERTEGSFLAAPLSPADAREAVRAAGLSLPSARALAALVRAVVAISRLAHDLRGRLTEVEANPLIVNDRGAFAVDALAVVR